MKYAFRSLVLLGFGAASCLPAEASAPTIASGAFNISPLRLEFNHGQQTSQLLLRNDSSKRQSVQIRLFAWSQGEAGDRYTPSDDYTISPSIVAIDPGQTQTIHVVSAAAAASAGAPRELSYRVVIDQLPESVSTVHGAAQTRLRLTLPLFAGTAEATLEQLRFKVIGKKLAVTNPGGRSVQLAGVALNQGGDALSLSAETGPHYILGGATMLFSVPTGLKCGAGDIRVTGRIDRNPLDAPAPQSCP